ncbi:arylamine N-acetyltransferase [Nocardioides sp. CN2-186]|uniref:arylamine N-acetyltransferase family protein n=1 Tax=Nocardioides tweenelious TaxID=3156607 RepID=UPI0032B5C5FE
MSAVDTYLARLGVDRPAAPTLDALVEIHHRHLEQVPYENLSIMLGRPPSVDGSDCLRRVGEVGRAGYCFHQNGAVELVLRDLGYDVSRRHGQVWTKPDELATPNLNHLVLVVSGLPTSANPGGEWWFDVGLGDGFHDPLPLVDGTYQQGGATYRLEDVRADGWSFLHDPGGTFTGIAVTSAPIGPAEVEAAHAVLSTPPGPFTGLTVVQRVDATGVDTVRGCLRTRGETTTVLSDFASWRAALVDLGLPLDGLDDAELEALFDRMWAGHLAWEAAGRP